MVKSKERASAKMERNVRTAGTELKAGMTDAIDPLTILSADPKKYGDKMAAGVAESVRTQKWAKGIEKAKGRNAWKTSADRAAAHYQEAAPRMVANAMEDYDSRAACIERAQAATKNMPTTTRAERMQKGFAYQEAVAKEFDKLYGRTA